MEERKGFARFAPLAGVLFLVLAIAAGALGGEGPPDADEAAAEHVEYWMDEDGRQVASAILGTFASVALVWFAGSVREAIARVERGGSRLASIAFGGAVLIAAGLTTNSALQLTAAETAGDVSPDATQTISALYFNFFFPLAAGTLLFLLACAVAAIRHGAFDRRLGWLAVAIAVFAVTPAGFYAFVAFVVWSGILAVLLYRRTDPVGSGAAESPLPPP
jgi:hypothetical protein